jgi:aerobic-type carbon monoxide dehydrogenase small subunit (CoxS/CutS family)
VSEPEPTQPTGWPTARYELAVNGTPQPVADAWIGESLLFVLRERLGFNAVKDGCGEGECGACTVLMDGQPTTACLVPAVTAVGRPIETPEVHAVPQPDAVATALALHAGAGCGFCLPGIGMELRALLARNATPSAAAIREALSGHRCRCLPPERFIAAADEAARAIARARPQTQPQTQTQPQPHVPPHGQGENDVPHVPAQARPGSRAGEQAGVPA